MGLVNKSNKFSTMKLIGPFSQLATLDNLPLRGALSDEQLNLQEGMGILISEGYIAEIGDFDALVEKADEVQRIPEGHVCIPSFVDCHTHICFAGSRAKDFSMRNAGKSYLQIAAEGGGIWSTVENTRKASGQDLVEGLKSRIEQLLRQGVTTVEVKSGYGLNYKDEIKMLRAIHTAQNTVSSDIISTCLAAHMKPKDFEESSERYLNYVLEEILTAVREENLSRRVDVFIEKSAFGIEESRAFLQKARILGFDITVHADQFTSGSARLAAELGAKSADHLEVLTDEDVAFLASSQTVAVALPGASLGLGEPFAPARKILDANGILAIASDWNPGSAPMGNLLAQASILATYEKLTTPELLSALTFRAAFALGLEDRGRLQKGMRADFQIYKADSIYEIPYRQGELKPCAVYILGTRAYGT